MLRWIDLVRKSGPTARVCVLVLHSALKVGETSRTALYCGNSLGDLTPGVGGTAIELRFSRSLDEVAAEWRAFQTSAWHTPFQDIDWVCSWFEAVGRRAGIDPFIVVGYSAGKLCFMLPFCIDQFMGLKQLCWLAQGQNDYNAPVVDTEFLRSHDHQVMSGIWSLIKEQAGVDLVQFKKMPARLGAMENIFVPEGAILASCSSHQLRLDGDWETFYSNLCSGKSRKRLREKLKRLSTLGHVSFRNEKDSQRREQLVRTAIAWKSQQLAANGDRNPFETSNDGETSALEDCLCHFAAQKAYRDKMRLDALYVGDRVAAINIALVSENSYSLFITAHEASELARQSPGKQLLTKSLELASRGGLQYFDFLAGDEEYKMRWCDQHIQLLDHVEGVSASGHCAAAVVGRLRQAKVRFKKSPRIMGLFRSVNRTRLSLS